VVGLNSALFAGYDGDDRGKLALGLRQVDGTLRKLNKEALLNVVLFHHRFACFHSADRVCKNMLMGKADLILTGTCTGRTTCSYDARRPGKIKVCCTPI
jgi:hypothetical protein